MRNLSNCKITTFRLNSALLTALFSMRREIKGGAGIPGGAVVSRGCSCLQGVQLSQLHQQRSMCFRNIGAVLALASGKAERRQLHPLR